MAPNGVPPPHSHLSPWCKQSPRLVASLLGVTGRGLSRVFGPSGRNWGLTSWPTTAIVASMTSDAITTDPILSDIRTIIPFTDPVHGHGDDSAEFEAADGLHIVVTSSDDPDPDEYMIGVYPDDAWHNPDENSRVIYITTRRDEVIRVVDAITDTHPEGTDRSAWVEQWLVDNTDGDIERCAL